MKSLTQLLIVIGLLIAVVVPAESFATSDPAVSEPELSAPAVDGELVIKFKHSTPQHVREGLVNAHGGLIFNRIPNLDIEAARFPALQGKSDPAAVKAVITALQRSPHVEYAEPNYIYTAAAFIPNDPDRNRQYAWGRIQAYDAWDIERGNAGTVIAIVDTGIQLNHPDLDGKLVRGWDFVDWDGVPEDAPNGYDDDRDGQVDERTGHGTHIAGTAAAETHNGVGGAGTCPNCNLMPVRVLNSDGVGTTFAITAGINFAVDNGARVINLSFGSWMGSQSLEDAVNNAWYRGAFLACSAGNNGNTSLQFPAAYDTCFAVASTDSSDLIDQYSTRGDWVEVAAPGSDILSTWIFSSYATLSGTSMAAPHVAGLAGLLASRNFNNRQIWDQICRTADRISGTGTNWYCGRINAYRAVVGPAISINCESGESQFACDAYVAGGLPPYSYNWEALRNATITYGSNSDNIWGQCTGGTYAGIRLTVRDSTGNTVAQDSSFYCNRGGWN